MSKSIALSLVFAASLSLAACGTAETNNAAADDASANMMAEDAMANATNEMANAMDNAANATNAATNAM
jgi:hypothetical protein